jgi:DNA-directed RNA polymerase specialized sigma24 family protein
MGEPGEDQAFLNAAIRGDRSATEQLLQYLSGIFGLKIPSDARRHVSDEGILHFVFSQGFRDIAQFPFRANDSFLAWLETVADNRWRTSVRNISARNEAAISSGPDPLSG